MFSRDELEHIGGLCRQHDVIILSDEVYERTVSEGREHVRIGSLPGMLQLILIVGLDLLIEYLPDPNLPANTGAQRVPKTLISDKSGQNILPIVF